MTKTIDLETLIFASAIALILAGVVTMVCGVQSQQTEVFVTGLVMATMVGPGVFCAGFALI